MRSGKRGCFPRRKGRQRKEPPKHLLSSPAALDARHGTRPVGSVPDKQEQDHRCNGQNKNQHDNGQEQTQEEQQEHNPEHSRCLAIPRYRHEMTPRNLSDAVQDAPERRSTAQTYMNESVRRLIHLLTMNPLDVQFNQSDRMTFQVDYQMSRCWSQSMKPVHPLRSTGDHRSAGQPLERWQNTT